MKLDSFSTLSTLDAGPRRLAYRSLAALEKAGVGHVAELPFSIKVLLENLLRHEDGKSVTRDDIAAVASWDPAAKPSHEINFRPARVLLQDFTGVPAVVDMAAMREAFARMGGDPSRINPLFPADLVIDHSVQVDAFGSPHAFQINAKLEMERNRERYELLRWGQEALSGFRVVPPDTGIVHQVNLEWLARVVFDRQDKDGWSAYPDTVVGTDSHTTMINGLGVVGWGVGGIEAEAALLGQPVVMLVPQVVGLRLRGRLAEGATATDLVLTVTQMLRKHGVVGKFVEFFGDGLASLTLPDRATIANMAPEYGATIGLFPVDSETLAYLRLTGRDPSRLELVEKYCRAQGFFRIDGAPEPRFSDVLDLDLASVEPCLAGPRRPQDRVPLGKMKPTWHAALGEMLAGRPPAQPASGARGIGDGSVVIAAITSCTNTSNPAVLVAAGLLAKKAVERGLAAKPWVKTSLAPGSKVVMEYLEKAGLREPLEALGFHLVGFGCTTCIGNSGPLPDDVAQAVQAGDLVVSAVLSGNRNFEGRINPLVKANWLASPPLVVAYALAGTVDLDPHEEPLAHDPQGRPVFLRDLWPSQEEIAQTMRACVEPEQFQRVYAQVMDGTAEWRALPVPKGGTFAWDPGSTYVRNPPFFDDVAAGRRPAVGDIHGARVLVMVGDSVTTDHISPAGNIPAKSPAGQYLLARGVQPGDFNSYGARRGNHEVMVRGTFANIRLRNQLAPGTEGGMTRHVPSGEVMTIFDASERYREAGVPLVVLAGKEYGSGSSRDWAAKGPLLLGVKVVLAESYERIHRSNLVGMGILPLQYLDGESRASLGLTGEETWHFEGLGERARPGQRVSVRAVAADGRETGFTAVSRIDTLVEVDYYHAGGILPYVLRQMAG